MKQRTRRDYSSLAVYLLPAGKVPGIGSERGRATDNGIARYRSPHGSTRYVYYARGEALAALQVVSRDGRHAVIANAYTKPEARRQGLASQLLAKARRDFQTVAHAEDHMMSDDAKHWRAAVRDKGRTHVRYR